VLLARQYQLISCVLESGAMGPAASTLEEKTLGRGGEGDGPAQATRADMRTARGSRARPADRGRHPRPPCTPARLPQAASPPVPALRNPPASQPRASPPLRRPARIEDMRRAIGVSSSAGSPDELRLEELLGEGSFGKVYKGGGAGADARGTLGHEP
jgi:hypothetical protein